MDDVRVRVKTMRARTVSELVGLAKMSCTRGNDFMPAAPTIISMVVQNITDMIFDLHITCLKWLISRCKPSL